MTESVGGVWKEWIIATSAAAVIMLGYVHNFIFPRTEAESLVKQVQNVDGRVSDLEKAFNSEIRALSGKAIEMDTKLSTLQTVLLAPAPQQQPQSRVPAKAGSARHE